MLQIQLQIFNLRSVIAEKKYAQKKIIQIQKEIDLLNHKCEQLQNLYEEAKKETQKNTLLLHIIESRGKVNSLNKYRKFLIQDLEIKVRTDDQEETLGMKAHRAELEFMEIMI